MGSLYSEISEPKNSEKCFSFRNNPIDTWVDILNYSSNLHGNWMFSKHIFYTCIVPTAEKNPALFAKWIREMVKKSGTRIKYRSEFLNAIKHLRKINGKVKREDIKQTLYYLLESGLDEPTYARRALDNMSA